MLLGPGAQHAVQQCRRWQGFCCSSTLVACYSTYTIQSLLQTRFMWQQAQGSQYCTHCQCAKFLSFSNMPQFGCRVHTTGCHNSTVRVEAQADNLGRVSPEGMVAIARFTVPQLQQKENNHFKHHQSTYVFPVVHFYQSMARKGHSLTGVHSTASGCQSIKQTTYMQYPGVPTALSLVVLKWMTSCKSDTYRVQRKSCSPQAEGRHRASCIHSYLKDTDSCTGPCLG